MLRVDEINNVISFEMDGKIYSMPVTQRDLDGEETEEEYSLDAKFFRRLSYELEEYIANNYVEVKVDEN